MGLWGAKRHVLFPYVWDLVSWEWAKSHKKSRYGGIGNLAKTVTAVAYGVSLGESEFHISSDMAGMVGWEFGAIIVSIPSFMGGEVGRKSFAQLDMWVDWELQKLDEEDAWCECDCQNQTMIFLVHDLPRLGDLGKKKSLSLHLKVVELGTILLSQAHMVAVLEEEKKSLS